MMATKRSSANKQKTAKTAGRGKKKKREVKKHPEKFPVVVIGAAKGGAASFLTFVSHLANDLGMAFVYVNPKAGNEKIRSSSISKKANVAFVDVGKSTLLKPNHVYLLPAGSYYSLDRGMLKQASPAKPDKTNNPIDFLMTSVAAACAENAIGVLLSGATSAGTEGLRAIKAHGGITFVQDASAKHQLMARHASDADVVDYILPAERIAHELAALLHYSSGVLTSNEALSHSESDFKKILSILYQKRGVDFHSHYKKTTVHRRILRRMHLNKLDKISDYAKKLRNSNEEIDLLYQDLLINVTSFFRDPKVYEALSGKIFPALVKNRNPNDIIRIWVPACATGEEACSIAICLHEFLSEKALGIPFQVFSTDLNEKAIEKARSGIYHKSALQNVSTQRLKKYFVKNGNAYQIGKLIRDTCIFAPHNLIKDPAFSRIDLISCQNVLIYLEATPQKKILQTFHYALKPGGYLLLGKSETIGNYSDLFEQRDKDLRVYTKRALKTPPVLDFSMRHKPRVLQRVARSANNPVHDPPDIDIEKETDKLLLSRYVPPSVVVNKDLEILRFRGPVAKFLEPAAGKASLNLLKMVRNELVFEVHGLVLRAKKGKPVSKDCIQVTANGMSLEVRIEVVPLKASSHDTYFVVLFREPSAVTRTERISAKGKRNDPKDGLIRSLEQELRDGREQMKTMSEEFESMREELQSANEEVISSNEELQSINEELETSKEELESSNEELTTINEELRNRYVDLNEARNYAEGIIQTVRGSLVVLTSDLRIRTANKAFYNTFKLLEGSEGKYMYELAGRQWDIPIMHKKLREILMKESLFVEFEIDHDFPRLGRKVLIIKAHKLFYNDGKETLILLAIDEITERKKAEEALRASEKRFHAMSDCSPVMMWKVGPDNEAEFFNRTFLSFTGYSLEEQLSMDWTTLIHSDDVEAYRTVYNAAFEKRKECQLQYRMKRHDGEYRHIVNSCVPYEENNVFVGFLCSCMDMTERIEAEKQKDSFLGIASHELKTPLTSIKAYTQILNDRFEKANDHESAKLMMKMDNVVNKLTNIVNNLLDVSRLEGGGLHYEENSFDLDEFVNEIVEETQRTATRHQLIKRLDKTTTITGDRNRLGQVLTNLISNAIKFSPDANTVEIETHLADKNVIISVRDQGIGITPEIQQKIFERFYRAEDWHGHTFNGLGLGLFISSEIIKEHGGQITVKSKKNEGSTFSIHLPLKKKQQ